MSFLVPETHTLRRRNLFGSQFQMIESMIIWLQGRILMVEGHGGAKLITSWRLESRTQGKTATKKYILQRHTRSDPPSTGPYLLTIYFRCEHLWINPRMSIMPPFSNCLSSSLIIQLSWQLSLTFPFCWIQSPGLTFVLLEHLKIPPHIILVTFLDPKVGRRADLIQEIYKLQYSPTQAKCGKSAEYALKR